MVSESFEGLMLDRATGTMYVPADVYYTNGTVDKERGGWAAVHPATTYKQARALARTQNNPTHRYYVAVIPGEVSYLPALPRLIGG